MGVGVLVERLRQFRNYNGDMKLIGLNLYTQRLFRMAGVTTLFDTYSAENEAIAAAKAEVMEPGVRSGQ